MEQTAQNCRCVVGSVASQGGGAAIGCLSNESGNQGNGVLPFRTELLHPDLGCLLVHFRMAKMIVGHNNTCIGIPPPGSGALCIQYPGQQAYAELFSQCGKGILQRQSPAVGCNAMQKCLPFRSQLVQVFCQVGNRFKSTPMFSNSFMMLHNFPELCFCCLPVTCRQGPGG